MSNFRESRKNSKFGFWNNIPKVGDLVWLTPEYSGINNSILGIVLDIENYSYWDDTSYTKWKYIILCNGKIIKTSSWRVEKLEL